MEIHYTVIYTKKLSTKWWLTLFLNSVGLPYILFFILSGLYLLFFAVGDYRLVMLGVYSATFFFLVMVVVVRLQISYKNIEKSGDGKWTYTLNEEGVQLVSAIGEAKINWELLKETLEMRDYLLLVCKGCGFIPVPKEILTPEKTAWIKGKFGRK